MNAGAYITFGVNSRLYTPGTYYKPTFHYTASQRAYLLFDGDGEVSDPCVVQGIANPVSNTDAANKAYVDSVAGQTTLSPYSATYSGNISANTYTSINMGGPCKFAMVEIWNSSGQCIMCALSSQKNTTIVNNNMSLITYCVNNSVYVAPSVNLTSIRVNVQGFAI